MYVYSNESASKKVTCLKLLKPWLKYIKFCDKYYVQTNVIPCDPMTFEHRKINHLLRRNLKNFNIKSLLTYIFKVIIKYNSISKII